jgi:hypothetical protein
LLSLLLREYLLFGRLEGDTISHFLLVVKIGSLFADFRGKMWTVLDGMVRMLADTSSLTPFFERTQLDVSPKGLEDMLFRGVRCTFDFIKDQNEDFEFYTPKKI